MGSFFSSKKSGSSSGDPVAMEAFNLAKPAIQAGVGGAIDLFNRYNANPAFTGQRVAELNPFQTGAANTLGSFSGGFTPAASGAASQLGFANLFPGMTFGSNAMDIFSRAGVDPTQAIISSAGQFADNPFTQGMIDSASRDVTRQLFERDLPGINRAATGAGNLNSTRAGVESAIATRGAADRLTDMSSDIRGRFFNQGLTMSQNQFNENLRNMLAANQDLLRAGEFGMRGITGAQDIAGTGFKQGVGAGSLFQGQEQAELDANRAVFDESLANRLSVLNSLLGAGQIGVGYKGGPQSTTEQSRESGANIVGSLLGAFSDRRMKHNIKTLGKTESGLPVYSFEYKPEFKDIAGHGTFVGFMADEVEKVIPEAVLVASNGYKMVDYSKVR